jgi:tetratricopeptide (TPR) repeat protein
MHQLTLSVVEYRDACHWYWRLADASGNFIADHEVKLNAADLEYAGFVDPPSFVREHAAPDRRREDEAEILQRVGAWMGRNVYGPLAENILAAGTPVTVRVVIPPEPKGACGLLYLPLELGHAGGKPLALQDVSLVFEIKGESPPVVRRPVEGALRMLAVFSLPTDAAALNLRRERYQIARMIRGLALRRNLAIDLRVLQYGVTRKVLREILEEGEGWDIVHFSGHGLQAHLVLERDDGTADQVPSEEVLDLLKPARGRLRWVTLSACLSAAATVQETLHWLGIEPRRAEALAQVPRAAAEGALPALARILVRELDCAVLAMRYPVGDTFAIDLAEQLYQGVLEKSQAMPRALQLALPKTLGAEPPDLSVATPALFGRRCVGLTIQAPPGQFQPAPSTSAGLAYFKERPGEYFVGRVGVLSKASAALAPSSRYTGVLFHGMAGGGKTACAVELAFHYEHLQRFTHFLWYRAPREGDEVAGALAAFAQAWETQLSDAQLSPLPLLAMVAAETARFEAFLPRVTEFLRQHSILLVLDNLESLLRPNGEWRDERWAKLMAVLLSHDGQSRLVLTSRIPPAPGNAALLELPVHALSLDESALLARQLPNLGRLIREERHRGLVTQTLKMVQGHPTLIDFAERQAASPEALRGHLERAVAAQTAGEGRLAAFFAEGESGLGVREFMAALSAWTRSIAESLRAEARTLLHFLCCLEEEDREGAIVATVWPHFWQRLGRKGDAPAIEPCLEPLRAVGLVDIAGAERAALVYRIHPGVGEAAREHAGKPYQAAADREMAGFWGAGYLAGLKQETQGGGVLVLRAGRSAVPYLMRQGNWEEAVRMLEQVVARDTSPATVAWALPLLRRTVEATRGTRRELEASGVLGSTLAQLGQRDEAEHTLRQLLNQAESRGEFRIARAAAGGLVSLLVRAGQSEEALEVVDRKKELTRRAGLGPWSQLMDEGHRLRILHGLGRNSEVLEAVERLREQMRALPERTAAEEAVNPWNVRETILNMGCVAALGSKRWEQALALNKETMESEGSRGATPLEIARTRFNDHGALLGFGRYPEARQLLEDCGRVYEAESDTDALGRVFGARAELENRLGHNTESIHYQKTALRYVYLASEPESCAISHSNLANYLMLGGQDPRAVLAHRLAAAIIELQTSAGRLANTLDALFRHLASFVPDPPPLPADFDELCDIVEQVEGVRFRQLFSRLPCYGAPTGDAALQTVLELARTQGKSPKMPEE